MLPIMCKIEGDWEFLNNRYASLIPQFSLRIQHRHVQTLHIGSACLVYQMDNVEKSTDKGNQTASSKDGSIGCNANSHLMVGETSAGRSEPIGRKLSFSRPLVIE